MSKHLSSSNIPHLVIERGRIAERWRSERWDSLVANGPAWHDRFPDMNFPGADPDAFVPKEKVADYFAAYAEMIAAPVRCGIEVKKVERIVGGTEFLVETSAGGVRARNVVAATGAFQQAVLPTMIPEDAGVTQIHSSSYRNPAQLPDGKVLVVGAGSSGAQIADELLHAGRHVYLSVGPHDRPPRAYRERDLAWWLGVLGKWEAESAGPGTEHVTIAVSGARGGQTVDFRRFAAQGMTLVGRTESYRDGALYFSNDLARNLARGDAHYMSLLDEADAYLARTGIELPEEPGARHIAPDPRCVTEPIATLNLKNAGITSVIWSTGFVSDFSWIKPKVFGGDGKPIHRRGVSPEPGIYFLGLPWLSRRGSSFIWGVWHDAKHIADHIATRRKYVAYDEFARSRSPQR